MLHNYKGQRAKPEKPSRKVMQVEDCMTKKVQLHIFNPEQRMVDVIKTLVTKHISGGPVVDDEGNLVGIISEGDCLREVVRGKYNNSLHLTGKVQEYMVTNVATLEYDADILDAAQKFLTMRLRRFPVMKEGKLIGQVSQHDVMNAVLQLGEIKATK